MIETTASEIYKEVWESCERSAVNHFESADLVNKPAHYQSSIEVIDAIEAWELGFNLGFNLGNCCKYISRAGKKDPTKHLEDLQEAKWYLEREIAKLTTR